MSDLNELRPIQALSPFKRFCCTIGNLPSSYTQCMSYVELLDWFCHYLQNTVIPAVNNNANSVLELQNLYIKLKNYVDNYFENIDVQEEINNKLDEMAENGILQNIIDSQYILYNKNIVLLGNFYQKLSSHQNITINCQGDSLTYGQDTNSPSVRQPDPTPADNGSVHSQTRANTNYPEQLQNIFNNMYDDFSITINNLGYSGDTAKTSYEKWINNRNADLALIMLGTNDSRVTNWIPSTYSNHIEQYIEYMSKIIEQYLNWNTGVILLTPPAYNFSNDNFKNGNTTTQVYRNILEMLGKKYNIPVLNTDDYITSNFDNSFFSDSVHFNEKGYITLANKLYAIFCGTGLINNNFNIENFTSFNSSINYPISVNNYASFSKANLPNSQTSNGNIIGINQSGKVSYGFNVKYDNAIIIPILANSNNEANIKLYIDNNYNEDNATLRNSNYGVKYKNFIENTPFDTARYSKQFRQCLIEAIKNNFYFLIPSKGLHTLTIENNTNNVCYWNGFYILPLTTASNYCKKIQIDVKDLEVTNNSVKIPLNLLAFFMIGNINVGIDWFASYILSLDFISGGGLVGYKVQFPFTNLSELTQSQQNLRINYVETYNSTISSSSPDKTELSNITCDENNLILEFSTLNNDYTMLNIS